MKRAEQMTWAALAGLIAIFAILLIGASIYHVTAFWAGAMLAAGQAVAVGLAGWGLMLARQAAELNELPDVPSSQAGSQPMTGGFRMSMGDDAPTEKTGGRRGANPANSTGGPEAAQTLDTGFQRLVVGFAGFVLLGLGGASAWLVYGVYQWSKQNPELTVPVVGTLRDVMNKVPQAMDEKGLLIGLGATLIYGILYGITRPKRGTEEFAEATTGTFTLGITAMGALAVATVLGYFKVAFASEVAAGVIAFFMILQGLELLVNACRSYSSIEELEQEAVDLQTLPLVPMLSSVWLSGLRMLFAASVGLSGQRGEERGVIARMMPRALLAIVIIAIGMSCMRIVQPGEVAVLERFGSAVSDDAGKLLLLQPGLHPTMPWPIDQLVPIPTERLQMTDVGTELHASKAWKGIDFQFWQVRDGTEEKGADDLFVTGDPLSPQILETYVLVQWRVTDPAAFYSTLSHSDFFEKATSETKTLPIYEAIVQQCTSFAVTRTFAIHSLEQVMISDRREVEDHCRAILQQKLDSLGAAMGLPNCGITVEYLTIKDLHPPYGHPDRPNDPTQPSIGGIATPTPAGIRIDPDPSGRSKVLRGPASAFEFVVSMREFREQLIALANGEVTAQLNEAQGVGESAKKSAEAYRLDKVARAHGDADRLVKITQNLKPEDQQRMIQIMKQRLFYDAIKDLLDPVTKIIVDKDAKDVHIYQSTEKGAVPVPPQP